MLTLHLMSTFGAFVWPESTTAHESASTITPPVTRLNQLKMTRAQNLPRLSGCFSGLQLPLVAMVLDREMMKSIRIMTLNHQLSCEHGPFICQSEKLHHCQPFVV